MFVRMREWRFSSTILYLNTRMIWVVNFTPRPLYIPEERAPGTHWIGGWVGPKSGLDDVEKRKAFLLLRGTNSIIYRRFSEPSQSKIRSWVLWGSEPRMTAGEGQQKFNSYSVFIGLNTAALSCQLEYHTEYKLNTADFLNICYEIFCINHNFLRDDRQARFISCRLYNISISVSRSLRFYPSKHERTRKISGRYNWNRADHPDWWVPNSGISGLSWNQDLHEPTAP
jgi:hypothetical protein